MIRTTTLLLIACFFLSISESRAQDFRVQISAFAEAMPDTFFHEKGVRNFLVSHDQMGLYRYFAGSYATRDEADAVQKEMVEKGFPYALVIDLEEQRVLCGANCPYFRNGVIFVQDPKQEMTVRNIYFDFGRYSLSAESKEVLNAVTQQLKDNPNLKLKILGHTDAVGSPQANIQLAASRSRSARNYLINKGIRADRMFIKVFGEASPLAENKTDEGDDLPDNRKWNRRVVLALIDDQGEVKTDDAVSGK
ncbi:MAG: OmpA family protein [Lewinellaceae bacterium]|nr:OmpA family protein [Lewinellaceae bacterium]